MLSGFTRQQLKPFTSIGKRQDLLALADLLTTGQVTPVIDRTYPLDEAADALRYVAAGHTQGKIVVTIRTHDHPHEHTEDAPHPAGTSPGQTSGPFRRLLRVWLS